MPQGTLTSSTQTQSRAAIYMVTTKYKCHVLVIYNAILNVKSVKQKLQNLRLFDKHGQC